MFGETTGDLQKHNFKPHYLKDASLENKMSHQPSNIAYLSNIKIDLWLWLS